MAITTSNSTKVKPCCAAMRLRRELFKDHDPKRYTRENITANLLLKKQLSMTNIPKKPETPEWASDWEVGVRVWVERGGQTILGDGRADLLAEIERTNSISAAARSLGISYRHAWMLVQEANGAAGEPLVSAAVGGRKGGGAQLTPRGKLTLVVFEQLRGQVRESAAGLLQRVLTPAVDLAATIHLAAAISLQEVIGQLLTEYALRQPSMRVRAIYGASNELADHVLAGSPCDLFISADPIHLDRLASAKLIPIKSRKVVATNSLAAIGPGKIGSPISSPRDLLAPSVKHIALADPASPLGKCSRAYLERLGIYLELFPKIVPVDNSRAILAAIRSGCADAGLAFASDAAKAADCRILFTIDPAEAGLSYFAAVCNGERKKDAQSLLEFFGTPLAQRCFRRCGLTLPKKRRGKS
jgi:molybdate transport system substrate-binding protein